MAEFITSDLIKGWADPTVGFKVKSEQLHSLIRKFVDGSFPVLSSEVKEVINAFQKISNYFFTADFHHTHLLSGSRKWRTN